MSDRTENKDVEFIPNATQHSETDGLRAKEAIAETEKKLSEMNNSKKEIKTEDEKPNQNKSLTSTPKKKKKSKKNRCSECNKKLGVMAITSGTCKCGLTFCSDHRLPEFHNCNFDHKSEGKRILEKENPTVAPAKVASL
eukprot:gb/GECH01011390.1/.p1 GENE.gb/GECH01011390.1/~~gb/GECH01011390.1/.p1  ORF type:complete len:139 (+),score=27.45 gb/GECH01011390.1/:1-417(+)